MDAPEHPVLETHALTIRFGGRVGKGEPCERGPRETRLPHPMPAPPPQPDNDRG